MLDSQTLLSQLRIRYDDCPDQPAVNNKAGAVVAAFRARKADAARGGGYLSPALPLPQLQDPETGQPLDMLKLAYDPHSGVNPTVVNFMNNAVEMYHAALAAHDPLKSIHDAADRVNELMPITKEPAMRCDPDLVLLSSMPGVVGIVAQQVRNGEILSGSIDGGDQVIDVDAIMEAAFNVDRPASLQPTEF